MVQMTAQVSAGAKSQLDSYKLILNVNDLHYVALVNLLSKKIKSIDTLRR
jgi:hypothetical protein